ncbi:MAG: alpha/beta hydrolase fold domain-containing protein [Planctomycetales bacterium]|nr:alpha/beta hydrolase fold domain-containing protein [Planctomycetales bacterium]
MFPQLRHAVAVLAVAVAAAAPLRGQDPADGPPVHAVEYARPGGVPLRLDLRLPPGAGPHPVVLCLHGGGWRSGDRRRVALLDELPARGIATASADYRLSDVAPYPAAVEDCRAAVRWLRAHAREHGLDPDRIGAFGPSAGGHLALMLGVLADDPRETVSARVRAVASWFGPADFSRFPSRGDGAAAAFLGATREERPDLWREASPVTHVSADDPPTLLVHGDRDDTVPIAHSEAMLAALRAAGVECRLLRVRGAGHGFKGEAPEPPIEEIRRFTRAFFERHMSIGGALGPASRPPDPPPGRAGPFEDETWFALSRDGLDFAGHRKLWDHASVPDIVALPGGRLLVTFVDFSEGAAATEGIGVGISDDGGATWRRERARIEGLAPRAKAVDPDPFRLPDGRIRLYYFASPAPQGRGPGDPARAEGPHEVRSAVSTDGLRFVEEDGVRFAREGLTDPDVVRLPDGRFRMYFPVHAGRAAGSVLSATSPDGLAFTEDPGVRHPAPAIPGAIVLPDGRVRLYVNGPGGIVSRTSDDGLAFREEPGVRIAAHEGRLLADPGAARLPDGRVALVWKRR